MKPNRFFKFISTYYVYAFVLMIILLAIRSEVIKRINLNDLRNNGTMVSGILIGKENGFRSISYFSFSYNYLGKKYTGLYSTGCVSERVLRRYYGEVFDVIVDKKRPSNAELLMFKKDYENYNIVKKQYKYEILNDCGSGLW